MMKGERGFTLVELIIAMAIAGLIVGVLVGVIYQIITVSEYGNNKLVAMHELQSVAHWVGLDGQSASEVSGGSELTLTLPDDSLITYAVVGTDLRRTAGESEVTLARNISDISFSIEDRIITMTITSSFEGTRDVNEQGTYKVYLRPTEEE